MINAVAQLLGAVGGYLFDRLSGRSNPEPKQGKPTPGDERFDYALERFESDACGES